MQQVKVRIVGAYFGTSGYAAHTRGLAAGLAANGADVRVTTIKPQDWTRWVSDGEMKMLDQESSPDEVMIYIGTPQYWRMALSEKPKKFIGFLVWEGSQIPKFWLPYLQDERVDQIWVPSLHVKKAIEKAAGITTKMPDWWFKIKIIPHGYDQSLFNNLRGSKAYEDHRKKRPFTFLANKGWVHPSEDRGGLQYVIKAFYEEFAQEDNARLLVKINGAYVNPQNKSVWMRDMLTSVGVGDPRAPIVMTVDEIPAADMRNFYGEADVFVSGTRAEGFNIAGLEAHACGLPTIQTAYGGHLDYMSSEFDWFVDCALTPVKHDTMYEEVEWAVPDIKVLRGLMRYAYEHQEEVVGKGLAAAKDAAEWTWNETGRKALDELSKL